LRYKTNATSSPARFLFATGLSAAKPASHHTSKPVETANVISTIGKKTEYANIDRIFAFLYCMFMFLKFLN
jgi:hypothetical protein